MKIDVDITRDFNEIFLMPETKTRAILVDFRPKRENELKFKCRPLDEHIYTTTSELHLS